MLLSGIIISAGLPLQKTNYILKGLKFIPYSVIPCVLFDLGKNEIVYICEIFVELFICVDLCLHLCTASSVD